MSTRRPAHRVSLGLQELLAADPTRILEGHVLVRREHPTDIMRLF